MNWNEKLIIFFFSLILCLFTSQTLAATQFFHQGSFSNFNIGRHNGIVPLDLEKIMNDHFLKIPVNIWQDKGSAEQKHQAIRIYIIKQLLSTDTLNFLHQPYSGNANFGLTMKENTLTAAGVPETDSLDSLIEQTWNTMSSGAQYMVLSKEKIEKLGPLFLRKSTADLEDLGYEVVSSRYRINTDEAYRRYNIKVAFAFLGNIRVLNPGENIRYLEDVQFDERTRKNYKNGLAIVSDDEISVYGGGICGGSTAAYQGFLTNTALDLGATNHSKWFSNLYTSTINGKKISTPGLDATVYARSRELVVTNTSDHPVVLVMNFNGQNGGIEEILSLGLAQDKGSLDYVGKKGNCYTRKINGKNKTSCYKEVH